MRACWLLVLLPVIAAADPRADHAIRDDRIGAIQPDTKPTVATLKKLVPELSWSEDHRGDAEGNDVVWIVGARKGTEMLDVIVDDDHKLAGVFVSDPSYKTDAGIHVGDRVKKLLAAYPDLACDLQRTEVDELECRTNKLAEVSFRIDSKASDPEGTNAPKKLVGRKIVEIRWRY